MKRPLSSRLLRAQGEHKSKVLPAWSSSVSSGCYSLKRSRWIHLISNLVRPLMPPKIERKAPSRKFVSEKFSPRTEWCRLNGRIKSGRFDLQDTGPFRTTAVEFRVKLTKNRLKDSEEHFPSFFNFWKTKASKAFSLARSLQPKGIAKYYLAIEKSLIEIRMIDLASEFLTNFEEFENFKVWRNCLKNCKTLKATLLT